MRHELHDKFFQKLNSYQSLPPAAKTLFEKRVLDSQKLFINKKFLWGSRCFTGGFFKKSPLVAEGKNL